MTTYIMGAGASRHAGYPLASSLTKELFEWIRTSYPENHDYRIRVDQLAQDFNSSIGFEQMLTILTRSPQASREAQLASSAIHDLTDALCKYFDSIRDAPAPLYDRLADLCCPGDCIITFNYDLAMERSLRTAKLWQIGGGYGFRLDACDDTSPVNILKLHGSTNWRGMLFGGVSGYAVARDSLGPRPVLFFQADLKYLGYVGFTDPHCTHVDSAAVEPALILPGAPKKFYFETSFGREWESFFDDLWSSAELSLGQTDHLVVIGYSMQPDDERARELIFRTPKAIPVTLCCDRDSLSLAQQFHERKFSDIRVDEPTFSSWLEKAESQLRA